MNTNKKMSIAVIFLAAAIIFVSSTPMAKNAFAQTIGEEEDQVAQVSNTGSQNYEGFLTCLSDAGGQYSYPAGNQIVNCLVESGYVQGSPSASASTGNTEDSKDQNENAQTSVVDDQSDQSNSDDQSDQSNSDDQSDQSNSDDQSDQSNSDDQSDDEE